MTKTDDLSFVDDLVRAWPYVASNSTGDEVQRFADASSAARTLEVLRNTYSLAEISDNISHYLSRLVAKQRIGVDITAAEGRSATGCISILIASSDVPASQTLIQSVVGTFNPGYWFNFLNRLIATRMTKTTLVQALTESLADDRDNDSLFFALEGLRLYSLLARDLVSEPKHTSKFDALNQRIDQLKLAPDRDVALSALRAEAYLPYYR